MWKIGFSNGLVVEPVEEYEGKVKLYVGPGNNSNLIKGVMRRRPWWVLTDKVQDASLVWTQIKVGGIFNGQKKGERLPSINEEESPTLPKQKTASANPLLNSGEKAKW